MHPEFWLARWQEGRVGFHQEAINSYLQAYFPRLKLDADEAVFVPLCGKSKDMAWLRGQGCRVVGVELSELAVSAFFHENGLHPDRETRGDFVCWRAEGITIWQGDFFGLRPEHLEGARAVYDRAAIIALPPDLRPRYASHLRTLLQPHARVLMITLEYDQREMAGPPFSVLETEVRALFEADFEIEPLAIQDKLAGSTRYREQGLSMLLERIFLLRA